MENLLYSPKSKGLAINGQADAIAAKREISINELSRAVVLVQKTSITAPMDFPININSIVIGSLSEKDAKTQKPSIGRIMEAAALLSAKNGTTFSISFYGLKRLIGNLDFHWTE